MTSHSDEIRQRARGAADILRRLAARRQTLDLPDKLIREMMEVLDRLEEWGPIDDGIVQYAEAVIARCYLLTSPPPVGPPN